MTSGSQDRCHVRIRSVLNFVSEVHDNLDNGMAKITLSIELSKHIIWIAEGKVNEILYVIAIVLLKHIFSAN